MRKLLWSFLVTYSAAFLFSSCGGYDKKSRGTMHVDMPGDSVYYGEKWRPQFHFSPESNWMNDPNGLVFFEGEYHLFYQYYPDSTVWGPMHWGHAISKNLIHWEHLPVALYPDTLGFIFSGSAVVDENNTSGFGSEESPPLVAIFTYHDPIREKKGTNMFQNQGIAYSLDKGMTWTKYELNPVLKNPGIRDFRDPKIFWNDDTGKWNLILAAFDRVHIYSSKDLKNWVFESEFGMQVGAHGGVWECPDLFPMKVEGSETIKWIMLVSINPGGPNGGSATQYFTGEFDGHKFVPDDIKVNWLDWGRDNYAGVTWSDIPKSDGRRIFIGWMSNWQYATLVPTTVWRSASTIPRELLLKSDMGSYFLTSNPVIEIEDIRIKSEVSTLKRQSFTGEKEISTQNVTLNQSELFFSFDLKENGTDTVGIIFENNVKERLIIGYSIDHNQFYIDRRKAGDSSFSNDFAGISTGPYISGTGLKLRLLIDASSVELFVDDGRFVMTTLVFPSQKYTTLKVFSKGGSALLNNSSFFDLRRVWK